MKTLTVDNNNDLCLNAVGHLSLSADLQAVLLACEHAVKTQHGEMIYATHKGIPYNLLAWDRKPNLIQLEAFIRKAITGVKGVVGTRDLQINSDQHQITYNVIIKTHYGEGSLNELRISN